MQVDALDLASPGIDRAGGGGHRLLGDGDENGDDGFQDHGFGLVNGAGERGGRRLLEGADIGIDRVIAPVGYVDANVGHLKTGPYALADGLQNSVLDRRDEVGTNGFPRAPRQFHALAARQGFNGELDVCVESPVRQTGG